MMLRYLIAILLLLVAPAEAQQVNLYWQSGTGLTAWAPITAANPLPITGTVTATTTATATATAAAPSYSEGIANPLSQNLTGDLRVIAKQSGTWNIGTLTTITNPVAVTGTFFQGTQPVSIATAPALVASSAIIGNVRIDQTTAVTTNGVVIAPTATAGAGIAPTASTAAESNRVFKASAGNLYTLTVTIGATSGYLMLFDATSLPGNGAVTPKYCWPVNSNGTNGGSAFNWAPGPPLVFATGITAGFSTTGCFTLTASATGNFFGQFQ